MEWYRSWWYIYYNVTEAAALYQNHIRKINYNDSAELRKKY
jgi:hypothetical protein